MAAVNWDNGRSVQDLLYSRWWEFEFFQAVRLLELQAGNAAAPGEGVEIDKEPVRFGSSLQLSFAPAEVLRLTRTSPPEMTVGFLSAGGVHGPLPTSFTEDLLQQGRKDPSPAAFLDLFHHRLISLLYRIRKAHHFALMTGWPEQTPAARFLFSFLGLGLESLEERLGIPDRALLRYTGLLSSHPRSAAGLAAMLSDYFAVKVEVEQFEGSWMDLSADHHTRIGVRGVNNELGRTALCGTRVWDQSAGVLLRIGPLTETRFHEFLPGGKAHNEAQRLAQFYLDRPMEIRIQLIAEAPAAARAQLGATQLGYNSWARTEGARRPDDQVHVRLKGAHA